MRQRRMTAIAIGCGLVCALCIAAFMASVQGQADSARAEALARYGGEQVDVCVATRDIAAGERVDASAVEMRSWVADLLPDEALRASGDAIGRVATSSIVKGEVISGKRFEDERDSLDVPTGKQAVSVPVKAVQAVGGAIRPGMSVDVYAAGDSSTSAIVHGVAVLDVSVGESGSLASNGSGWITLATDPENVQELIAASSRTTLYFALPGSQAATDVLAEDEALEEGGALEENGALAENGADELPVADIGETPSRDEGRPWLASSSAAPSAPSASSAEEEGGER